MSQRCAVAGLLLLLVSGCREPPAPAPPPAPPAKPQGAAVPAVKPAEASLEKTLTVKPGELVKVAVSVDAGDVAVAVASAMADGVAPTLAVSGAKPAAVCRNGFLNQRQAAVVLRPEKQQKVELAVGCAEDHGGPVLLRVVSATAVEPGKPVNGALASFQDFAFYRLPAPDEVRYDVKVAAGKGVDTLLMAFSLPKQRLAAMPIPDLLNDDGPLVKGSSAFVWRTDYGRQGLLCVTAARPDGLGPYRLQVTALTRGDVPQPPGADRNVRWPSPPD